MQVKRFGDHHNAFGSLRLLFAALVIVSHTPAIVDGTNDREPLVWLFGTIGLGDLAVDGFFVVSGFLIAGSWQKTPQLWPYLQKRVARIFPGFAACTVICAWIIAPLVGGAVATPFDVLHWIGVLSPPQVDGVFPGTHYAMLNVPVWTIAYEFRCYLLVAALGIAGMLGRPAILAALATGAFATGALLPASWAAAIGQVPHLDLAIGDPVQTLRLVPVFLIGTLYYVNRDRLAYRPALAVGAAAAATAALCFPLTADIGPAIFGGYLIMYAAHRAGEPFTSINNRNDVSYGLYLYAWPIEKLIFWQFPGLSLLAGGALTIIAAYGAGWASWRFVEKPALKLLGGQRRRSGNPHQAAVV